MKPAAEEVNACDDWLISPAIHLFAGKTYIISFEIGSALSSGIEEKMSVCIGTAQTVEAMTSTIIENLKNTRKTAANSQLRPTATTISGSTQSPKKQNQATLNSATSPSPTRPTWSTHQLPDK